jgi:hypothetical protein
MAFGCYTIVVNNCIIHMLFVAAIAPAAIY